ncbi:AraC family transcriptional regulator [Curtobacterium pusillum]|uniref:helix-turn-helix transcriptional regulator n=1 Tax=Curtobacterium pusillum TaxID=69373 RepID=UPI0011A12DEC|nr:AraC family transcriptional regulator [Curtobacterium pusillum]
MTDVVTDEFADDTSSPATVRFEVSGHQPADAARDLGRIHGGERWVARPVDGTFDYRYTALGDAEVTVRRSQMHGTLSGVTAVGHDYVVLWMSAGTAEVERTGERYTLPLEVPVLLPPDNEYALWTADYDQRVVHLDRAFVQRVAVARVGVGEHALRFDDRHVPDPEAARRWQSVLTMLARSLRVGGPESAAWQGAKTAAAEVFLEMFPPQVDHLPAVLGLPRNARLRAAVEYIHDHAAEPVTIAELSAASGLSVRSVQESFRRVFDVSPLTYLRHVRLDRVRAELLEADAQVGAVGDVARRWGFAHLGRFSASYAERFGEYPKQTLRR